MLNNRIIITPGGSVGAILGVYDIFGTSTGSETVTVFDETTVTLQPDFNRGGDTLRLRDVASDFQILRAGSNVVLTSVSDAVSVTVPVGIAGLKVVFENSAGQLNDERTLLFNGTNVVLGNQVIGFTASQVLSNLNTAPVITSAASITIDENAPASDVVYRVTATDPDAGQTLTYSLAGTDAALFTINSATGEVRLRQSANFEAKQSYAISVQASDGVSATARAVTLTVRNVVDQLDINGGGDGSISTVDARGTAADLLDVNYRFIEQVADANDVLIVRFTANDVLSFDSALSGYSFSNTGADLIISQNVNAVISRIVIQNIISQTQLVFDAATANAALNQALGTSNVSYLTTSPGTPNAPPVVANSIPDQVVAEDTAWSYSFPANSFSDPDSSRLSFEAGLSNGQALPSWLSFNGSTRTFNGTPPLNFNGNIDLRVAASDGTASVNDDFRLTVTPVNDAPLGVNLILAQKSISLQTLAAETKVNTYSDGRQWLGSVAGLADGGWVVTWESIEGPLSDWAIFGQRYNVRSDKLGPEFLINKIDSVNRFGQRGFSSSVIGTEDGGWLVTWTGFDQSGYGVYGKVYDRFGQQKSDAILINNLTVGDQVTPDVNLSKLFDGSIVHISESFGQNGSAWGVYQKLLSINGNPVGVETLVNAQINGNQFGAHGGRANSTVSSLVNGGWVVAWTKSPSSFLQDGGLQIADNAVFAQIFDQTGSRVGSAFQVNAISDGNQNRPTLIGLDDGGFAVAWWSWSGTRPGDAGWDIYIQRFSASGLRIGAEFRLNDYTNSDQHSMSATRLADGKIVFTWSSVGQDGHNEFGIVGRIFDEKLNKIGSEFIINTYTPDRQITPSVSALGDGGFIVAWQSNQNGQPEDIYSQRFDSQGNRLNTFTELGFATAINSDYKFGALLQFDTSQISDADGLGALAIQWQRSTNGGLNWANISGATGVQYQLGNGDVGALVRARATYTDGSGFSNEVLSSPTGVIAAALSNSAPLITNTIPDQAVAEDASWSYVVPANTFSDADGNTLTYTASLASGAALPSWLTFNAATRTFSGTPPLNFNGNIDLRVAASDGTASVNDDFRLTVTPVNDVPVVASVIADQSLAEDSVWSYQVPVNTFSDADGNTLTYSASLASGTALPAWLTFNGSTRTFNGTPPLNFNGNIDLRVTASDGALSTSDTFRLTVTPVNDAPVITSYGGINLLLLEVPQGIGVFGRISATDPDAGSNLTYFISGGVDAARFTVNSVTGALRFNSDVTYSSPIDQGRDGTYDVTLSASDGSSSVEQRFSVTVGPPGAVLQVPIGRQSTLGTIVIAGDDGYNLFFNGVKKGEGTSLTWTRAETYSLNFELGKNVIGVLGINNANGTHPGAIIAQIDVSGLTVGSSKDWIISTNINSGWLNDDFVPKSFRSAIEYGNVASEIWFNSPSHPGGLKNSGFPIDSDSKWIWSEGFRSDSQVQMLAYIYLIPEFG